MADQPLDVGAPGIGSPGISVATAPDATSGVAAQPLASSPALGGDRHLFDLPPALVSLVDRLRRRRRLVVGASAAFVFLLLVLAVGRALFGSAAWAYDFKAYYGAAWRLIESGTPYSYATVSGPFHAGPFGLYLYSPVPVIAILPLAFLPIGDAALVYLAVRLAMLVAMCALMPISRTARLAMLGVACLSAPVIQDLNLGNASLVVTFFAVVAWRFLDRPLGSIATAVAISIRPTMALFVLWWLVRGRWAAVIWTVVGAVGLFALTLPFVGVKGWLDYMTVLGNLTAFESIYRNFALGALTGHAGWPAWASEAALYAGYAIAIVAVLLSLRRDRELSFVVTLGATLLLSPLLWDHYFTNLLVPAAFLVGRGKWWALILPLLCWLPQELLAFIAIGGLLLPFAAPDKGPPVRSAFDALPRWRRQAAPA